MHKSFWMSLTFFAGLLSMTPISRLLAAEQEVVELHELLANSFHPWPSQDGLTLYFAHKEANDATAWVYSTTRKDADSLFGERKKLVPGRDPTVTDDGLEMILLLDSRLQSVRRSSIVDNFGRPRVLSEIDGLGFVAGPSISPDGLTLYADRTEVGGFVRFTRPTRQDKWGPAEEVVIEKPDGQPLRFLQVTADKKFAVCATPKGANEPNVSNLYWFSSPDQGRSFRSPRKIEVPGTTVMGNFPRFVPKTRELFFAGWNAKGESTIYVIKEFSIGSGLPNDLSRLQGDWSSAAEEVGGNRLTRDALRRMNKRLSVKGNSLVMERVVNNQLGSYTGRIELKMEVTPKQFDWTGEGPDGTATTLHGIYELNGDRFKICYVYASGGQARPSDFTTAPKSGRVFVEFQRDAAEKNNAQPGPPVLPAAKEPSPAGLAVLQGKWVVVSEEWKGRPIPAGDIQRRAKTLMFEGDRLTFNHKWQGKAFTSVGTVRVTGASIDFTGAGYNGQPQEFRGIFEQTGETLRLAYPNTSAGLVRPTAFASSADSDTLVIVARRQAAPVQNSPPDAGWTALFNGQDLTGWIPVASSGQWSVTDGILTSTPGQGWLGTSRDYADFELELEYRIPPAGNTGVFLRAPIDGAANGADLLEVQLIDETAPALQNVPDRNRTGALRGLFAASPRANAPPDSWNELSIRAVGSRITVVVNGMKISDGDLSAEPQSVLKPSMRRTSGRVGLQRQSKAEFRNVKIKDLSVAAPKNPSPVATEPQAASGAILRSPAVNDAAMGEAGVKLEKKVATVEVTIGRQPFATYNFGKHLPKPFFSDVRSAGGSIVTRGLQNAVGHPHHKGIWVAVDEVNGINFCNEKGKIENVSIELVEAEGIPAKLRVLNHWLGQNRQPVVVETTTISIFPQRLFVYDIQFAAGSDPVTFADTKEGLFCIRLADSLREAGGSGSVVNAEGLKGSQQCWGKPSNWIDYYGPVEGRTHGVAVFDHPDNPRRSRYHVRNFGLLALNPFGAKAYTSGQEPADPLTLQPGLPIRLRYGLYVHRGDTQSGYVRQAFDFFVARARGESAAGSAAPPERTSRARLHDGGSTEAQEAPPLRDALQGEFLIGAALDSRQLRGEDPRSLAIAVRHFNALSAGNSLKPDFTQPSEGKFTFGEGDKMVEIARQNGAQVVGHTLVWHSQTPAWFFQGPGGKPPDRALALARMRKHIATVVGRYKGNIAQWDVVNEALSDEANEYLRPTPWLKAIGPDYIEHAFRAAHEADPSAILMYNDYNVERQYKRPKAIRLLKELLANKAPIHAVGIQGHWHLNDPDFTEVEAAIEEFAALGLQVMITELDMSVLPSPFHGADLAAGRTQGKNDARMNPFTAGLPEEVSRRQAERYRKAFEMFLRQKHHIGRVTFWGVEDTDSWLNNFPISGRTDYPLLFDRRGMCKPAFFAVRDAAQLTRIQDKPVPSQ